MGSKFDPFVLNLFFFLLQQISSAYIAFTGDLNTPTNNYYLDPVDSAGSMLPLTGYAGINRLVLQSDYSQQWLHFKEMWS